MRKQRIASAVVSLMAGALISIPIVIAKINYEPPVTKHKTEYEEWQERETETETIYEELSLAAHQKPFEIVKATEPETETETTIETVFAGYEEIPLATETQITIKNICECYGVEYELMLSIAYQESRFDMSAYNPVSSDWGMFQINEASWNNIANELGFYNYKWTVEDNTAMACYIVSKCLTLAGGDYEIALNYYRTGTPNTKYEADSDYASIVLEKLQEYRGYRA